jgi:hypothetical protein
VAIIIILVAMVYNISLVFFGLLSLASALAVNNVPVATPVSNNRAFFGVFPTPAPASEDLRRRQASQITQETLLAAPDNTCGYFGGSSGSSPASRFPEECNTYKAE